MILPLHLLLVADEPVVPALDALRRAGYDPRPDYVATPKALGAALERRRWDVVLVCPDAGGVSAWDALARLQRHSVPPPMFVLADEIDDADVVALIEEGARDVIRTDQLSRLGVAVARAVRSHRERTPSSPHDEASDSAFYALAEHMPVGLYRSTEDGRILYANPALARMLGRDSVDELLGEAIVGSVKYPRDDFSRQIAETGEVRDFEMRWKRADGHEIVTRESARAVRDEDGALLYYEGTMEDVTDERRVLEGERHRVGQLEALVRFNIAVDAAHKSDDLYGAVIRVVKDTMHADVAVLVARSDDDFDIHAWSQSLPREEVQACREQEVWRAYPVHTQPMLVSDVQDAEGPELIAPVRTFMQRNGLRALGSFPLLHRGHPLGALVVFLSEPHIFTEGELRMAETLAWHVAGALSRWQAEAELRDSETTLRTITDTTGHVPYRLRFGADTYDHLSPSIERLTGYAPGALKAAGGLDALTETYRVVEGETLKEGGTDAAAHYLALHHLRTASGELRWVEDSAYPWVDESGQVIGLVGVLQDVTEWHEREAAAHEQTRRNLAQQRALNELSALDADADVVLRRATEVAAETMGTGQVGIWLLDDEAGEMQCRHLYSLSDGRHDPERAPAIPVVDSDPALGGHRVATIADLHDQPPDLNSRLYPYHERYGIRAVLAAPIRRQGRSVGFVAFEHVGTARTWTLDEQDFAAAVADLAALTLERQQRARAEDALRESERRYRAISTLGADYAYAIRVELGWDNHIEWATDAFERITGYTPEEVADVEGLLAMVHEHDRSTCQAKFHELLDGRTIEIELRIVTKAGEERWICHRSLPVIDEQGRLRQVYSTGQDITDRKRFEAALVAAREQAEEMARNKSTFLADMSHEIRTPLTGILGFAGVLAEEVGDEHREFALLIERSGRRLLETINSVLDLAQLESDGLEPTPEPLNVVEEARQAVLLLSPLAEKKGIVLRLDADADRVMASADPTCLHRVFNNIVGNAIKFTDEGEVSVEVRAEGEHIRLVIRDTGIGIDAEFLPHLFSEFRQETKKNEQEGSGLGLAITKKLVELMDGTVVVESVKGEGSAFTITLPLLPSPSDDLLEEGGATEEPEPHGAEQSPLDPATLMFSHPLAHEADDADEQGDSAEPRESGQAASETATYEVVPLPIFLDSDAVAEWSGGDGNAEQSPPALRDRRPAHVAPDQDDALSPAQGRPPAEPTAHDESTESGEPAADAPRVLIVTDDAEVRDRLEQVLEEGCVLEAVAEARVALDQMTRRRYDALVLDVNLGGKQTGIGVLRVARTLPGYEGVFAVALVSTESERDAFTEAGFDYCLSVPFSNQDWLGVLRRAVSHAPSS